MFVNPKFFNFFVFWCVCCCLGLMSEEGEEPPTNLKPTINTLGALEIAGAIEQTINNTVHPAQKRKSAAGMTLLAFAVCCTKGFFIIPVGSVSLKTMMAGGKLSKEMMAKILNNMENSFTMCLSSNLSPRVSDCESIANR